MPVMTPVEFFSLCLIVVACVAIAVEFELERRGK
jgi:hypothetical protein